MQSQLVALQLTSVHFLTQENLILFSQNKSTIFVHKYPFQATPVGLEAATAPTRGTGDPTSPAHQPASRPPPPPVRRGHSSLPPCSPRIHLYK